MNLIKGKVRLFCVSNIVVSFACTGFLGPRYFEEFQGPGQNDNNEVVATDDVIPLSQLGEGESIIESIVQTPSVEEMLKLAKKNAAQNNNTNTNTNTNTTSKKVTKTSTKKTVTTSVVKKKEVKASSNYAPAVYSEVTGSAVVNYAKRYMGLKYVYAGRSLATGTDCSGFTSLIYKEFGVTLPKTVSGQVNKGTYVKKADLQKGDLVFYSSGSRYATHVGIYIGDGKVIHESNPRDGVKISSVNMMKYITARRVINSTAKKIAEQKVTEEKKIETSVINTDASNSTSTDLNNVSANNSVNNNINSSVNNTAVQENINDVKETNSANESLNVDESTKITSEEKKESEVIMDSKKEDSSKVEVTEVKEEPTEVKVEVQKEQVKQEQISENNEN